MKYVGITIADFAILVSITLMVF